MATNFGLTILFTIFFYPLAWSMGGMHGGGGVGVRCQGKLESLDLFEGRQKGLTRLLNPLTDQMAIEQATTRFANHFWNPETIPLNQMKDLIKKMYFESLFFARGNLEMWDEKGEIYLIPIVPAKQLPLSNDFGEVNIPSGCELEQIIYFDDKDKKVFFDIEKYNELDRINKVALVLHEISYFVYRHNSMNINDSRWGRQRTQSSQEAREFTAKLLSFNPLPRRSSLISNPHTIPDNCNDDNPFENAFYTIRSNGQYIWLFKVLYNYWTPYLTYIHFDNDFSNELFNLEKGTVHTRGEILYNDGRIHSMGLFIEVTKQPGFKAQIRVLNENNEYLDDGPRIIYCEKGRPIKASRSF